MKKFILLIIITLITSCCNDKKNSDGSLIIVNSEPPEGVLINPWQVVIDSCEYIGGNNGRLAHKGNCRFCQKRLEDLLDKKLGNEKKDSSYFNIY